MNSSRILAPLVARTTAAAAGLLAAAPPAFAATFNGSLPPRDLLLVGSVGLLLVAVVARLVAHRTRPQRTPPGPDLRWWKNQNP